jgi:NAD dependent epimerase/dehydratase family enzyme
MGKMGEELLLAGKKIRPKKALDAGYIFKYKTLEEASINHSSNTRLILSTYN